MDVDGFTPALEGAVDEDTGETITPQAVPTWDDASRSAAIDTAESALTAFARPTLDHATWWAELSPLLTQQAQLDYSYVDPANVPATAVTGEGAITDETSAYVATVAVPTDAGTYDVLLTRTDALEPWLASRFTPPEEGR